MGTIDYAKLLGDLKDAVLVPVKGASKDFLDANKDAQDFLEDRAKRLAELGVDYVKADSDDARDSVSQLIRVVRQSMANEISQVAVNASYESRSVFGKILDTAFGVVIKILPVIAGAA